MRSRETTLRWFVVCVMLMLSNWALFAHGISSNAAGPAQSNHATPAPEATTTQSPSTVSVPTTAVPTTAAVPSTAVPTTAVPATAAQSDTAVPTTQPAASPTAPAASDSSSSTLLTVRLAGANWAEALTRSEQLVAQLFARDVAFALNIDFGSVTVTSVRVGSLIVVATVANAPPNTAVVAQRQDTWSSVSGLYSNFSSGPQDTVSVLSVTATIVEGVNQASQTAHSAGCNVVCVAVLVACGGASAVVSAGFVLYLFLQYRKEQKRLEQSQEHRDGSDDVEETPVEEFDAEGDARLGCYAVKISFESTIPPRSSLKSASLKEGEPALAKSVKFAFASAAGVTRVVLPGATHGHCYEVRRTNPLTRVADEDEYIDNSNVVQEDDPALLAPSPVTTIDLFGEYSSSTTVPTSHDSSRSATIPS